MRIICLASSAISLGIFGCILGMIFESVCWKKKQWEFLPWWFCDLMIPIGCIAAFLAIYYS